MSFLHTIRQQIPTRTLLYFAAVVLLALIFVVQETTEQKRNTVTVPSLPEGIDKIVLESGGDSLTLSAADTSGGSQTSDGTSGGTAGSGTSGGQTSEGATDAQSSSGTSGGAQSSGAQSTEWRVGEEEYPGDDGKISSFIDTVGTLEEADIISARGNYQEYGLDGDSERVLTFSKGGTEVLTLRLGDKSSAGDALYARINNQNEVVMIPQGIGADFSVDDDPFRLKKMASISKKNVEKVAITSPEYETVVITPSEGESKADSSRASDRSSGQSGDEQAQNSQTQGDRKESDQSGDEQSSKSGGEQHDARAWKIASGDIEEGTVKKQAFDQFFSALSPLRANGFPDQAPTGDPFAGLTVTHGGTETVISIWPPTDEGNFPARVSSNQYSFTIPKWRAKRLLLGIERYTAPYEEEEKPSQADLLQQAGGGAP